MNEHMNSNGCGSDAVVVLPVSPVVEDVVVVVVLVDDAQQQQQQYDDDDNDSFRWTTITVLQAIVVFMIAAMAEIGGGYLVWKAIRGTNAELTSSTMTTLLQKITSITQKRYIYAICGSFLLVLYGFIPTLQPTNTFGRIYAVYGGFFIIGSYFAGYYFDHTIPDIGDIIGGSITIIGVFIILFWSR